MNEIWKEIPDTNGFYSASNLGRIKSNDRIITTTHNKPRQLFIKGKILSQGNSISKSNVKYKKVVLVLDLIAKTNSVHRLVAKTFISNPENKPSINHIDGDGSNNCIDNLEWCTQSENLIHCYQVLKRLTAKCDKNGNSKLTREQVLEIRKIAEERGKYYGRKELALKYNVSEGTIKEIITRRRNRWDL